ncbi:unnamed protein product [Closterium sp. NIES-65]|nr:unnamed protein product [Closterium sp. NIES-65]
MWANGEWGIGMWANGDVGDGDVGDGDVGDVNVGDGDVGDGGMWGMDGDGVCAGCGGCGGKGDVDVGDVGDVGAVARETGLRQGGKKLDRGSAQRRLHLEGAAKRTELSKDEQRWSERDRGKGKERGGKEEQGVRGREEQTLPEVRWSNYASGSSPRTSMLSVRCHCREQGKAPMVACREANGWRLTLPEVRWSNNATEVRWSNNATEVRWSNNATEVRWSNNATEVRWSNNASEVRWSNNATEVRWSNNATEVRWSNNATEVRWSNNATEVRWSNNPTEVRWSNNATEVRWSNNATEVRWSNNATERAVRCHCRVLVGVREDEVENERWEATRETAGAISSVLRLAPSADAIRGGKGDDSGRSGDAQRRKSGQAEQRRRDGLSRAEDEGSLTDEEEEEGHRRRVRLGKERRLGQPWNSGISPAGQRAFRRLLLGADGERGKAERVLSASAEAEAERQQGRAGNFGRVDRWSRRAQGGAGDGRADGPGCDDGGRALELRGKGGEMAEKGGGESSGEISASDIMTILKGLGNKGRWRDALAVFHWARGCGKIGGSCAEGEEAWRERGNPMVSLVLRILSRCDRPNEADDLFRALVADGCALDVYAYTAMMSALSRAGRFNDAIALFHSMRADAGVAPSIVTFNVVLAAYARKRGCFHHMASLLQEIRTVGLTPDEYTYNTMISACADAIYIQEAERIFAEMRAAGLKPTRVTYNALLDVYGKAGHVALAHSVLESMLEAGVRPNLVTYNEMISACARKGLWREARGIVDSMLRGGEAEGGEAEGEAEGEGGRGAEAKGKAYGKGGQVEEVRETYQTMLEQGCFPNLFTFNILLDIYGKNKLFADVAWVMDELATSGIKPDVVTWNTLIRCYAGDASRLLDAVSRLEATGKIPRSTSPRCPWEVHKSLVLAFCKCGCVGEAEGALERMRGMGHVPDLVVWNAVLGMYGRLGRVERAERVRGEMRREGVGGDVVTHNVMMSVYGREGMSESVEREFEGMKTRGVSPDAVSFSSVVLTLCVEFEGMKARGVAPDAVSYSSVLLTLCKVGRVETGSPYVAGCEAAGSLPFAAQLNAIVFSLAASTPLRGRVCEAAGSLPLSPSLLNSMALSSVLWPPILLLPLTARRYVAGCARQPALSPSPLRCSTQWPSLLCFGLQSSCFPSQHAVTWQGVRGSRLSPPLPFAAQLNGPLFCALAPTPLAPPRSKVGRVEAGSGYVAECEAVALSLSPAAFNTLCLEHHLCFAFKVGRVEAASRYVAECEAAALSLSPAALNAFASGCISAGRPTDAVRAMESAERRAGRLAGLQEGVREWMVYAMVCACMYEWMVYAMVCACMYEWMVYAMLCACMYEWMVYAMLCACMYEWMVYAMLCACMYEWMVYAMVCACMYEWMVYAMVCACMYEWMVYAMVCACMYEWMVYAMVCACMYEWMVLAPDSYALWMQALQMAAAAAAADTAAVVATASHSPSLPPAPSIPCRLDQDTGDKATAGDMARATAGGAAGGEQVSVSPQDHYSSQLAVLAARMEAMEMRGGGAGGAGKYGFSSGKSSRRGSRGGGR